MTLVNRLLAIIVALALATIGFLVGIETIHAAVSGGTLVLPYIGLAKLMRQVTWSDPLVVAICIAISVLGLLLSGMQLVRPPSRRLPMQPLEGESSDTHTTLDAKGLRQVAHSAATSVDGIGDAKVVAGRRKVTVTAVSSLRDTSGQLDAVKERVADSLRALTLVDNPRVKVSLREDGS